MTNTPTRRDILKAAATTAVTGTAISVTASATSTTTVRTVEAGIRYDLNSEENFSWTYLNSRPPYTIDTDWNELVYPNRVSASMTDKVSEAGALFAESPVSTGNAAKVGPKQRQVQTLPTKLSTRKRPMEGISLTSGHHLPEIFIQRNGQTPRLVVPSEQNIDLSSGTDREIRLPSRTVEARTVRVTDEVVPIEGRPEHRWGPKREYGSVEVEVTPVVEVVDHGELPIRKRELP